jgi:hypothetical protein
MAYKRLQKNVKGKNILNILLKIIIQYYEFHYLQISNLKVTQFKIEDCVLVPDPKVDKGPLDSVNIIAIVTEQKHELNCLGTKNGLIKGWFNSSTLQPATSNFINMSEVDKAKELSLREIVALTTGG